MLPLGSVTNLANAMLSMTLPSTRTVPWHYDIANRVDCVGGGPPPCSTAKSYASAVQYASQGGISNFNLGNGLAETRSYDPYRQQPTGVMLGTTANPSSLLNLGFAYCEGASPCASNNGNLRSQTIASLGVTQTYGYDGFNRSEAFNYDNYGNRWVPAYSGIVLSPLTVQSNSYNSATNR